MQEPLSPELYWMTLTILLTALLWVPYIINQVVRMGLIGALGSDPAAIERSPWALRATAAHRNAVENLVIFAPLAIAVHITGASTETTALACMAYFFIRAAHYIIYVIGISGLRTLVFAAGVVCQFTLIGALLGWS